eukprot:scaffold8554_cov85-Cylindrotheca_fusiformis.AAC.3
MFGQNSEKVYEHFYESWIFDDILIPGQLVSSISKGSCHREEKARLCCEFLKTIEKMYIYHLLDLLVISTMDDDVQCDTFDQNETGAL